LLWSVGSAWVADRCLRALSCVARRCSPSVFSLVMSHRRWSAEVPGPSWHARGQRPGQRPGSADEVMADGCHGEPGGVGREVPGGQVGQRASAQIREDLLGKGMDPADDQPGSARLAFLRGERRVTRVGSRSWACYWRKVLTCDLPAVGGRICALMRGRRVRLRAQLDQTWQEPW
jgi:hypothetical protein